MSRVGKKPIPLPSGVSASVGADRVAVKGPLGELETALPAGIRVEQQEGQLQVLRQDDSKRQRAFHGLVRSLLANAVQGVSQGFRKDLEIVGIGYKAQVEGKEKVVFNLGYSHPIAFPVPPGITIQVEKQTRVMVSGIDRQRVGQTAAEIRSLRRPEPYKGKGIRYVGEEIKRKAGKTGA